MANQMTAAQVLEIAGKDQGEDGDKQEAPATSKAQQPQSRPQAKLSRHTEPGQAAEKDSRPREAKPSGKRKLPVGIPSRVASNSHAGSSVGGSKMVHKVQKAKHEQHIDHSQMPSGTAFSTPPTVKNNVQSVAMTCRN